jgi:hypothetical protein
VGVFSHFARTDACPFSGSHRTRIESPSTTAMSNVHLSDGVWGSETLFSVFHTPYVPVLSAPDQRLYAPRPKSRLARLSRIANEWQDLVGRENAWLSTAHPLIIGGLVGCCADNTGSSLAPAFGAAQGPLLQSFPGTSTVKVLNQMTSSSMETLACCVFRVASTPPTRRKW